MKTYIIGSSSNLSQRMKELLPDSILLSARDILTQPDFEFKEQEPFNLIINAFWPATRLRNIDDPVAFVDLGIVITAKILKVIKESSIHKIFYTSSASVYGDNKRCYEEDDPKPKSLHAALKLANEQLVATYCKQMSIPYSLIRVFNLYGGRDEFSIVSKIISAQKSNAILTVVNDGSSVRDFVHIDDVVLAYKALLEQSDCEEIINIASGKGRSVLSMLVHMRKNGYDLRTENINRDEISLSIADVSRLNKYLDTSSMRDPRDFIIDELRSS